MINHNHPPKKHKTYKMNYLDIIHHFYPEDTPLRRLLLLHSECVRDKALALLEGSSFRDQHPSTTLNIDLIIAGSMLHDIGICATHAPGILCEGTEPYICHGTIGARMLRQLVAEGSFSAEDAAMLEACARICERHTGAGLTRQDILSQGLPIEPAVDLLPETLEEQLVCLADKFFSKSGDPRKEKSLEHVRRSMMKFGADSLVRFDALCSTFNIK